jgi:D-arabinose 1-dehydrogenase-like Zn-dependent alcohol dehydrogenase
MTCYRYLPFKHQNIGPETRVGVIGIGGLGHLAVGLFFFFNCINEQDS